jgi:hypothetical protein
VPEIAAAPLAVFGIFFEFKEISSDRILSAHELEDGNTYELVITTHSGLYRYQIHDLVRVEGFTSTTPNIVFVSKSGEVANLCGEKISSEIITEIIGRVADKEKWIREWCLVLDHEKHCYNFCLEVNEEAQKLDVIKLRQIFEDHLISDTSRIYQIFRQQGLITPAVVTLMKPGWYAAWKKSKMRGGDAGNQLKMPMLCKNVPANEYILKSPLDF